MDMWTSAAAWAISRRRDRKDPQLAYARTLLTVFKEAVNQLAVVVENLEQIQAEEGAARSTGPPMASAKE